MQNDRSKRHRKGEVCQAVCFHQEKIQALREAVPTEVEFAAEAIRYKALAHPGRLRILRVLALEECCVCDLALILDQHVATLSQNLRQLRAAGLVQSRQEGKYVFYSLPESVPVSIEEKDCCGTTGRDSR